MNYETASDAEINMAVAIELGMKSYYRDGYDVDGHIVTNDNRCIGRWNPCNEAYQSWPIIHENRISIVHHYGWGAFHNESGVQQSMEVNPLRAAMIVFLKMRETNRG